MHQMKRAWHSILVEPLTWIFDCFFHPAEFRKKFERKDVSERIIPMCRLAFPLFLVSYPLAMFVHISFYISNRDLVNFLLAITVSTVLNILVCIGWGVSVSIGAGITGAIILNIILSLTDWSFWVGITGGLVLGIAGSIKGRIEKQDAKRISRTIWRGIALGFVASAASIMLLNNAFVVGFAEGKVAIVADILGGIGIGTIGGVAGGVLGGFTIGITGSILVDIATGIAGGIVVSSAVVFAMNTLIETKGLTVTFPISVGVGVVSGIATAIIWSVALSAEINNAGGITRTNKLSSVVGIVVGIVVGFIANMITSSSFTLDFMFIIFYVLSYYRLPLYLVSALSMISANLFSWKNPSNVFTHLHRSSLYWDENVFLPLPYLSSLLLKAVKQNVEQTLEEIAFIKSERPQQIRAVQAASLEIAIRSLEMPNSLQEIATAYERLEETLLQESRAMNPLWDAPFTFLAYASRYAVRYCNSLARRTRRKALKDMIMNLQRVEGTYPKSTSSSGNIRSLNEAINKRLNAVVSKWLSLAQQALQDLEQGPSEIDQIDNPYKPGQVLELDDESLFVGREDLVQQLELALGRGSRCPTFFLNGERRMGKTSTLRQLPKLLGDRYLPIFFDLQMRGISSSTPTFLRVIAGEVYKTMDSKGMQIEKLEYKDLQEASQRNEATAYFLFDEWLRSVERILEQQDKTLLLTFDEFEKLEEVGKAQYLDLTLLLDWFRSVIQNRSRIALLFSGIHTIGEMDTVTGINWAGYFVNVQTLKVGFLQPKEAYQLITRPIPDYPSKEIFGEGVVDEIIQVTGCHPFMVQAVCSALIDNLNAENRYQAEIQDVSIAVDQVLKSWWDTHFRDLWNRTSKEQQVCLSTIKNLGEGDLQKIARQSGLDEKTVRRTLQTLIKRDLVLQEDGIYRIAAPIFTEWVERNS